MTRISAALLLVLSFLACTESQPEPRRVSGAEARALVARGATLLDVRTPAEFAAGHLEGAVLVPVDELQSRLSDVPRGRPVVVYCQAGARSRLAASTLARAGYEVHDLGGMSNWN